LKRNFKFILAGAVLALVAILWTLSHSSQTPPGQPQLVTLSAQNLSTLFQQFDAASDRTRVVALLSPT